MPSHSPDPTPAFPDTPEGGGARPNAERDALLQRIAAGRLPSRTLVAFMVEALGPDCLTTQALKTMAAVLDAIESQ